MIDELALRHFVEREGSVSTLGINRFELIFFYQVQSA